MPDQHSRYERQGKAARKREKEQTPKKGTMVTRKEKEKTATTIPAVMKPGAGTI